MYFEFPYLKNKPNSGLPPTQALGQIRKIHHIETQNIICFTSVNQLYTQFFITLLNISLNVWPLEIIFKVA